MRNPNCGACGHMNTRGFCNLTACIFPCPTGMGGYINKPQTNADRIRVMTDEELADELLEWFACFMAVEWSRDMILDWLKEEVSADG